MKRRGGIFAFAGKPPIGCVAIFLGQRPFCQQRIAPARRRSGDATLIAAPRATKKPQRSARHAKASNDAGQSLLCAITAHGGVDDTAACSTTSIIRQPRWPMSRKYSAYWTEKKTRWMETVARPVQTNGKNRSRSMLVFLIAAQPSLVGASTTR